MRRIIFLLVFIFAMNLSAQITVDSAKTVIERIDSLSSLITTKMWLSYESVIIPPEPVPPDTTPPVPPDPPEPEPQPPDTTTPEYAGTVKLTLEQHGEDVLWLSAVNFSDRILGVAVLKNLYFDYVRCDDFRNRVSPLLGYTGDGRITADSVTVQFIDPVERGGSLGIGIVFTGGIVDEFDVVLMFGNDRVTVNIGMLKEAEVNVPARDEPEEPGKVGVRLRWDRNTEPDLAGYIVKYGMARGSVAGSRYVDDPDITFYDMDIFTGLTYWFCVQAFDRSGNKSRESEWVSFRE